MFPRLLLSIDASRMCLYHLFIVLSNGPNHGFHAFNKICLDWELYQSNGLPKFGCIEHVLREAK